MHKNGSFLFFSFFLCMACAHGQLTDDFDLIDKFRINKAQTKVWFKDPLKQLIKRYPDFDKRSGKEKYDILDEYLHNNALYLFQANSKNGTIKNYVLKGNPKKIRTRNYFKVEIVSNDGSVEKTVDRVNLGGALFENMVVFQSEEAKKAIGKMVNFWGFFSRVEPYANIKEVLSDLIAKDMDNQIPEELLAKDSPDIAPFFEYQICAAKKVAERKMVITVYNYDAEGKIKHAYPSDESDTDLYNASISQDDISGATSLPWFSALDTVTKGITANEFIIYSTQPYIRHYLKDVKLYRNAGTGDVEKIEAKLLIHGYSAAGESINYECYVAEFAHFGDCVLPATVKFCPLDDPDCTHPRIITTISYKMK